MRTVYFQPEVQGIRAERAMKFMKEMLDIINKEEEDDKIVDNMHDSIVAMPEEKLVNTFADVSALHQLTIDLMQVMAIQGGRLGISNISTAEATVD